MARKSHFDTYLEYLNRCVLQWEALRLNPEYRRDWEENKEYLKSPEAKVPNSNVQCWLNKIAVKWGIPRLINPYVETTEPQFVFTGISDKCIQSDGSGRWGFSMRCDELKCKTHEACFGVYLKNITKNPFILSWNRQWVYQNNPIEIIMPSSQAILSYVKREKAHRRIVLWIIPQGVRERIQHEIFYLFPAPNSKSQRVHPKTKSPVKFRRWGGFLLISLPLGLANNSLRMQVKRILSEKIKSYEPRQMRNMWEALKAYETKESSGQSFSLIAKHTFPNVSVITEHRERLKEHEKSPFVRRVIYKYSSARHIIEEPNFAPLIYRPPIDWRKLSPKHPPALSK